MLDEMISKFNTYKHYDTNELQKELNEILDACGLGTTGADTLANINYDYDGSLQITTHYSCRSCAMSDDFTIPAEVMNANDRIEAGKLWAKNEKIKKLSLEFKRNASEIVRLNEKQAEITKELEQIK